MAKRMRSVVEDFANPYSAFECWSYDRFVAPAVADLAHTLESELQEEIPGPAEVLDVGCGGGQIAILLAERRPDARFTGLDLSPDQIGRARRRGAPLGERLGFVVGSALDLPFPDARFDAVYSVASIKHWPDPARGLSECARVLRPGGLLFVVEADRGCRLEDARSFVGGFRLPGPLKRLVLPMFRTWVAGQALDLDDARALMGALPLRDVDVSRIPGTPGLRMKGRKAERVSPRPRGGASTRPSAATRKPGARR